MVIAISDLLAFYAPTQDIGSAHGMTTVISHSYLHGCDCDHRRKVVGILNLVFRRNSWNNFLAMRCLGIFRSNLISFDLRSFG
jgi:hypothetical protein